MEPKKKIILYHLGKINMPIANFESNAAEAKLCVDLLNRHLLSENGSKALSEFDKRILKRHLFFYLRGKNGKETAYYVGINGVSNFNDDPKFEEKIVELTGDLDEPSKNPLRGGRKNSDNSDK